MADETTDEKATTPHQRARSLRAVGVRVLGVLVALELILLAYLAAASKRLPAGEPGVAGPHAGPIAIQGSPSAVVSVPTGGDLEWPDAAVAIAGIVGVATVTTVTVVALRSTLARDEW